jgi:uncharacterized protein (TIGR02145 family)
MVSGDNSDGGALFELDVIADTCIKKFDFNYAINGGSPNGPLLNIGNEKLYGMTKTGGEYNKGVIFEWDLLTKTYIKKIDFNGAEKGSNPSGSLMQAGNGKLYGTTDFGGNSNDGVLFEWDPVTNVFNKKIDFNDSIGTQPQGMLIQARNEGLFGTTKQGGSGNYGVLFEWDPIDNIYIKRVEFDKIYKGCFPISPLLFDNDKIYGVTQRGGSSDYGVLYEWETAINVCPSGWHLPSGKEFQALFNHFQQNENWGKIASDPSSFGIQFGGMQDYEGTFSEMDESAYYWTATEYDKGNAEYFSYLIIDDKPVIDISRKEDIADIHGTEKSNKYSVRCIKN